METSALHKECGAGHTYGVLAHAYGQYWRYANCVHNVVRAIRERILMKTHLYDDDIVPLVLAIALKMAEGVPLLDEADLMQLAINAGLLSKKGQKYAYAKLAYEQAGVSARHALLSLFIKDENYAFLLNLFNSFDETATKSAEDRIPRPIQHRHPVWFVFASRFFLPFEHWFLNANFDVWGLGPGGPSGRTIGKGLSHVARAKMLYDKFSRFTSPVCFSMDGSKWDRQVNVLQLVAAAMVMAAGFNSSDFAYVLKTQMASRGTCRLGNRLVQYTVHGGRFSGDLDTGMGNCLIFLILLVTALYDVQRNVWTLPVETAIDGDDALAMCESEDFDAMSTQLTQTFYKAGHNLTVEGVTSDFESIVWCQSHPVLLRPGEYVMVRDPRVAISKAYTHPSYSSSDRAAMDHLYMVAVGEYIIGLGVPIMQSWALKTMNWCIHCGAKPFRMNANDSSTYRRLRDYLIEVGLFDTIPPKSPVATAWRDHRAIHSSIVDYYPAQVIHPEARLSLQRAFGISVFEQNYLEAHNFQVGFGVGDEPLKLFK